MLKFKTREVVDTINKSWLPHKSLIVRNIPFKGSVTMGELKECLEDLPKWVTSSLEDMLCYKVEVANGKA